MRLRDWLAARIVGGGSQSDDPAPPFAGGWLRQLFGQRIDRRAAMEVAAVYGGLRQIAGGIAQMPLVVKHRSAPGRPDSPNDHPIEHFWNVEACPLFSGPALAEWVLLELMFEGNAIVYCPRSAMPRPPAAGVGPTMLEGLYPIPWSNVQPLRAGRRNIYRISFAAGGPGSAGTSWVPAGSRGAGGGQIAVDQDDVLHFHGLEFDGLQGLPAIGTGASRPIAVERAMTEHVGAEFSRGSLQKIMMIFSGSLTKDQKRELRRQWVSTYAGGIAKQHLPMVLDRDAEVKAVSQTSREMQGAALRDQQVSDIGRAVGVPGILLNQENRSTSWGTGVEAMTTGFLRFTLQEHISRLAGEINRKLFAATGEYAVFDDAALLRGTVKERYEAHERALGPGGWKSVNDVRRAEGLEPYPEPEYDRPRPPAGAGA